MSSARCSAAALSIVATRFLVPASPPISCSPHGAAAQRRNTTRAGHVVFSAEVFQTPCSTVAPPTCLLHPENGEARTFLAREGFAVNGWGSRLGGEGRPPEELGEDSHLLVRVIARLVGEGTGPTLRCTVEDEGRAPRNGPGPATPRAKPPGPPVRGAHGGLSRLPDPPGADAGEAPALGGPQRGSAAGERPRGAPPYLPHLEGEPLSNKVTLMVTSAQSGQAGLCPITLRE